MRGDLALFFYFLLTLFLSLLLGPNYILAIIRFDKFWTSNQANNWLLPLELGKDPNQLWYFLEYGEFKPVFLFCPWTIETPTERLEVTKTRIDFSLHRQFQLRLQVRPTGEPLLNKIITPTKFHGFLFQQSPLSKIIMISQSMDFPNRTWQLSNHY